MTSLGRLRSRLAGVIGIAAVAGLVGLVGCGSHGGDDDGGDGDGGVDMPFSGTLDYERSGGFVSTRTTMHIDPDGKMTWVRIDGSTTRATLPAATMTDLRNKVDQADFSTLQAVYRCNCNDDVVHKIQVDIAGAPHMVTVDDTADYPARLHPLVMTLEGMTQTARAGD